MKIHSDFFQDEHLSRPFFELQRMVYPWLDLRWTRDNGFLTPHTTPFGLFENGRALSILNATTSEILMGDRTIRAVQLGTVATHPEYRNRGFSRRLINAVFRQYRESTDIVFLYANDQVLEFYPKLGFGRVEETQFTLPIKSLVTNDFRKLDPKDPSDKVLIFDRFDRRVPLSRSCGVEDYGLLAKWYALTFFAENLWYWKSGDILLVASVEERRIIIQDVVSSRPAPDFFRDFSWPLVDEAALQFVPDQFNGSFAPVPASDGDALFVRGKLPTGNPIKIPVLAHT